MAIADVVLASYMIDGSNNILMPDHGWTNAIINAAAHVAGPRQGDVGDQYDTQAPQWAQRIQACSWFSSGALDAADTVQQRATLYAATGAWAIDDESFSVASFAALRGIPFAILRSVSDDYSDTLPLAARGAVLNPDGSANIQYLIQQIKQEPIGQTLDLVAIAAYFNESLASLQAAAVALCDVIVGL